MANNLLPPNATSQERSLEATTARLTDVPVLVRQAWSPDDCQAELLPWLAWAFSVDEWGADWTDDQKRAVINEAARIHRLKGTVASIRRVFESLGFGEITIDEGRNRKFYDGTMRYDGFPVYGDPTQWAWYRVRFNKLLSNKQADQARALLAITAPLRCHLWSLDFTGAALLYNAVANYDGSYNHGVA